MESLNHHIINCLTGEEEIRPHTNEEATIHRNVAEETRQAFQAANDKQQRRTDAINVLKERAKDDKVWHAVIVALGLDGA